MESGIREGESRERESGIRRAGSGISGAGPSIFALCKGQAIAEKVAYAMSNAYLDTGIAFDMHISKVNDVGTKIITN